MGNSQFGPTTGPIKEGPDEFSDRYKIVSYGFNHKGEPQRISMYAETTGNNFSWTLDEFYRQDGLPDDCGETVTEYLPQNPPVRDGQPPIAPSPAIPRIPGLPGLPFPSSSLPNLGNPAPAPNLVPPGDPTLPSTNANPSTSPATPAQPAPDSNDESPDESNPTGDSCSADSCQQAIGNKLDDIGRDTDQIEGIKDQLENLLDYEQDAYRHNQVMDKLQEICNRLDKEGEEDPEASAFEPVNIAYCDCSDRDPEIKFFEFTVKAESVPTAVKEFFLDSAQKAFLQCSEPELFIPQPERFQLKRLSDIPQLVMIFRMRGSSGKWDKDGYRITIPHYNGPKNERPNISDYTRGNVMVRQYLRDSSQVSFYVKSKAEGIRVLAQINKYIPSHLISEDRPTTFVETRRQTPSEKVTFYHASFYKTGNEKLMPNWKVWYEGREKVGKGQPQFS